MCPYFQRFDDCIHNAFDYKGYNYHFYETSRYSNIFQLFVSVFCSTLFNLHQIYISHNLFLEVLSVLFGHKIMPIEDETHTNSLLCERLYFMFKIYRCVSFKYLNHYSFLIIILFYFLLFFFTITLIWYQEKVHRFYISVFHTKVPNSDIKNRFVQESYFPLKSVKNMMHNTLKKNYFNILDSYTK